MSVAQMSSMEHLNTTWLAEWHDKLVFLGLKLLKLIPIRSLVLGNQAEEQSLEGKISPREGAEMKWRPKGGSKLK